jgi:hypothetical protein
VGPDGVVDVPERLGLVRECEHVRDLHAKRRLILPAVALACVMAGCLPASEASREPGVRSVTPVELPFPGGVGAIGDSPWGLLAGGGSQDRTWLAVSRDGLGWDQIGEAVTRELPRDSYVVDLATRSSDAAVLVDLDINGNGELGILWSGDGMTWRLVQPPALQDPGFVRSVGITGATAGYVVVAYTARDAVFDVIVAQSPDGQRWTRVRDDHLDDLGVIPTAVTSDGSSTFVLLDHTPYEANEDPALLVGSASAWRAISVEALTNQVKQALAVTGDQVLIGGCTLGPPAAGRIWTVRPAEPEEPVATALAAGTCVTTMSADASGVTGAGSDGGAGWAWQSRGNGTWDAVALPAVDSSRSVLQVDSVARTDFGAVVGGTASAPIGGARGVAPVVWLIPEPAPTD